MEAVSISERATAGIRMPEQRGISDEDVEKALDWLRDNAVAIGEAKARMMRADFKIKHIEALLTRASIERSVEARKAVARTDERWIDATNEAAYAAGEFETMRALREAATLKIEAWRTQQSNFRAMKI